MSGRAASAGAGSGAGLRRFVTSPSAPPERQTVPPGQQGQPAAADVLAARAREGQPTPGARPEEACEMCAAEIPADHGHLADLEQSTLMCACRACYLLFTHSQAGRGRYRAVPDRYRSDPAHPLSPADWDALEVPVGLAFFLRSGDGELTGFYPSPAGATECRLDLQAWQRIARSHPMLTAAEPDVEAVLIYRADARSSDRINRADARSSDRIHRPGAGGAAAGVECFLVPIDACYELAGRMRLRWRGFDGGSEARASIAEFLDDVRSRARAFSQEA
jgi:hypothetical protein